MKKSIILLLAGVSVLIAVGCEKQEIMTYDSSYDAVRFCGLNKDPDVNNFVADDAYSYNNFSFIEDPLAESAEYDIPVYLSGKPSLQDREIGFVIDKEITTAPDSTYKVISHIIPAGEITGSIKVEMLNTEELSDTTYIVAFTLVATDELMVSQSHYLRTQLSWNNSIPLPSNTQHTRSYNMLIQSSLNYVSTSKAALSNNAMKAIVAATGWNDWDDKTKHPIGHNASATYGYYKYLPRYAYFQPGSVDLQKGYALILQDYLDEYAEEHDGQRLLHDIGGLKGQPVVARKY